MAIGPGWFAFASSKKVWFPGPTPLRLGATRFHAGLLSLPASPP
ncbi:MAG: hypothetical protein R2911_39155 [Caldilineaceae bacterium]